MKAFLVHVFGVFAALGGLGLVLLGILDSSFLFLPLGNDLLMLVLTARSPRWLPYYAAMATLGSISGCAILDWISRKGGEEGLERVLPKRRIEYVKKKVSQNAGWALAVSAIMPPPFPFTPFVAGAAAFQYPRRKLYPILAGMRFLRFTLVGVLAILFGKRIIALADQPVVQYTIIGLMILCIGGSAASVYGWIKRSRRVAGAVTKPRAATSV